MLSTCEYIQVVFSPVTSVCVHSVACVTATLTQQCLVERIAGTWAFVPVWPWCSLLLGGFCFNGPVQEDIYKRLSVNESNTARTLGLLLT